MQPAKDNTPSFLDRARVNAREIVMALVLTLGAIAVLFATFDMTG